MDLSIISQQTFTVDDFVRRGLCMEGVSNFRDEHFPGESVITIEQLDPLIEDSEELSSVMLRNGDGYGYGDGYGDGSGDGSGYGYGYGNGYGDGSGDGNGDGYGYGDGYGDGYGNGYGDGSGAAAKDSRNHHPAGIVSSPVLLSAGLAGWVLFGKR